MADITKCKGLNCPLKETCYRYSAKESDYNQTWFLAGNVGISKDDEFECVYYWPNKKRE
jgi:hypothetical protein